MPNVYRIREDGSVEAKWVDNFRLPQAFADGWSTIRPTGPTADISLPIQGWPHETPMLADVKETVGLLWIAYLTEHQPGMTQGRPVILNIEEGDGVSPTGNPRYRVTWSLQGAARSPSQLPTLQQFGTTPATSTPWSGTDYHAFRMTEEITLYPDEAQSGNFRVIPTWQEPGIELGELSQEVMDAASPEAAQQIVANDVRLAGLFQDIADQRKTVWEGMREMSNMVGWEATQKLFQWSNLLIEGGLGIDPAFLPHLSRYNVLSIGTFIQDLQEAIDPRYLEGTALNPTPIFQGRWGRGVKDPARVDTLLTGLREAQIAAGLTGEEPGFWNDIPLPPEWSTMDDWEKFAYITNYMATQNQAQYVAPDRDWVRDYVRNKLVSLVGSSSDGRVEILTDIYLNADLAASQGQSIDPEQAITNAIRAYPEYRRIHALRPEFINEADWLGYQFQQLLSSGMRTGAVQRRAITQAIAGGNPYNAAEDVQTFELMETGQPLPGLLAGMEEAVNNLVRALP